MNTVTLGLTVGDTIYWHRAFAETVPHIGEALVLGPALSGQVGPFPALLRVTNVIRRIVNIDASHLMLAEPVAMLAYETDQGNAPAPEYLDALVEAGWTCEGIPPLGA